MSIVNFYNQFHKYARPQYKLINSKNITYRIIIGELKKHIKLSGLKILDYGCGVGTLSNFYASKKNEVVGVDISNKAIKIANESRDKLNLNTMVKFYNLRNKTKYLHKGKYDLIICSEVIEHVANDEELIKSFNYMLSKNGYLFISTPSKDAPLYKLGLLDSFDKKVGHLRRYNKKQLERLLIKNNFKIIFSLKTEGILRNFLYTNDNFSKFLKYVKGIISDIFTFIDNLSVYFFGESNLHILAKKSS